MAVPTPRPFDYQTLTQLRREKGIDAAQRALDGVQRDTPEEIVMGAAVLFAAICKQAMLNPHDLYAIGSKVITPDPFHRRANDSIQSLKDFVSLRVIGRKNVSIS